jgi:hypothetical protein
MMDDAWLPRHTMTMNSDALGEPAEADHGAGGKAARQDLQVRRQACV